MKKSINFTQFCDEFASFGRENTFSYEGKHALFEHIEDIEEATGEEMELDVVALCVEFSEFESLAEVRKQYPDIESVEDLEERTQVIRVRDHEGNETGGLIIQDF